LLIIKTIPQTGRGQRFAFSYSTLYSWLFVSRKQKNNRVVLIFIKKVSPFDNWISLIYFYFMLQIIYRSIILKTIKLLFYIHSYNNCYVKRFNHSFKISFVLHSEALSGKKNIRLMMKFLWKLHCFDTFQDNLLLKIQSECSKVSLLHIHFL